MTVSLLLIGWFYLDLNFTTNGVMILAGFSVVAIIIDIVWLVEYQSVGCGYLRSFGRVNISTLIALKARGKSK